MHLVVIHSFKEDRAELVTSLANALGLTAYEARSRMIGGGPAVVASFADSYQALSLAEKLNRCGFSTMIVDAAEVRSSAGKLIVRRFDLNERSLLIETTNGKMAEMPYQEIKLLLPTAVTVEKFETKTVTERKFSIAKTLALGGIPMTTKVERRENVTTEEQRRQLYLYADKHRTAVFSRDGMTYEGFGVDMKLSREQNFNQLVSELRRLCPGAVHDHRLLNRLGQVRVLGPALNPETNLDLAAEILARSLLG